MVVEQVVVDRYNNVDSTLAIPMDDDSSSPDTSVSESPRPESAAIAPQEPSF